MAKVKILRSLKTGGKWLIPNTGDVIELDDRIVVALLRGGNEKAIDIVSNEDSIKKILAEMKAKPKVSLEKKKRVIRDIPINERETICAELVDVDEVDEANVNAIIDLGFYSIDDLKGASVDDLTPIKGIGKATAEKIIDSANEFE